jgi:hypothetical protein
MLLQRLAEEKAPVKFALVETGRSADSAAGTIDVVVNNNGNTSAPATAQLRAVAPAFFMYPGTNYAITSRLPDYALVGDPSAIPGRTCRERVEERWRGPCAI